MKDNSKLTDAHKKALDDAKERAQIKPEQCGMEEALDLGFINDPQPPVPQQECPYRFRHSRTDFTKK